MAPPLGQPVESHGKDWVALVLTIGLCTGVNLITLAVLIDALISDGPGLSENATQILVAVFGGMVGVIGSYIGYRAGSLDRQVDADRSQDVPEAAGVPSVPPDPVRLPQGHTGTDAGESDPIG